MNSALKKKLVMFVAMVAFMIFYLVVFGSKNMIIGFVIMLAAFMNLGNDLSFKPVLSVIKISFLLLILGISAYLNNPLTIWGCILTFIVVFGTTFTSYNLFGSRTYLPYLCYKFNGESLDLIRQKCGGNRSDKKTALLIMTNIVRENIEVTDENRKLYDLQIKITDICNFILNYLDVYEPSDDLKNNLVNIIENNDDVNDNLDVKDRVVACCMKYVTSLYKKEKEIVRS